jgi:hypothetical protein
MKLATLLICALLLVGCSRHEMKGRVIEGSKVDFGDGVIGTCVFDNEPHLGDKVTVSKDGRCHAEPQ